MLRKLWVEKLQTTQILASLPDDLEIQRLAETVDKIDDNKTNGTVFTAIQTPSATSVNESHELIHIKKKSLGDLTVQLKTINHLLKILESDLSDALTIRPY